MARRIKRYFKEIKARQAGKDAWGWLRKLPEYRAAFKTWNSKSASQKASTELAVKSRWGFYPLCDPQGEHPPQTFTEFFITDFAAGLYDYNFSVITIKNGRINKNKTFQYVSSLSVPPKEIMISFNYQHDIKSLESKLSELFSMLRTKFPLIRTNVRADYFMDCFKMNLMERAGANKSLKRFRARILKTDNPNSKESKVKQLKRRSIPPSAMTWRQSAS